MKFLSQINVNTEYILPFVDGTNGQVLTTDGNGAVYWGSVSAGSTNLNALTDVELTSPTTGQILRYEMPQGGTVPIWRNVTPGYLDATSSINALGDVTITSAVAGQILQFNGTFWINTTLSTVEYVSKVQHTVKAGVAITKGQAVYVTSADGTNMIVGLASNASEATSSKVIGLAASNAAINGQIFVVTEGLLAGLDTSTATAGDPVWLGTNGNLIFGLLNKPSSPAHLVYIGVVTRAQQNNGEIFVNVQNGIEIDEIHDVQISSPATGQLLRRDSDGYWKNWTPNFLTSFTETDPTVPSHVKSITATNISNWNAGYNDSIRAIAFSTTTGVVTLTQQDGGTLTVDLDGRYLESFTETDTLATVTGRGNTATTHIGVTTSSPINLATAGNIGTWIGGIQDGTSGWSIANNGIGFKADNTTYAGIVLAPANGILYFGRTSAGGVGTMNSWLEVNSSGVANFKQARPQHNGSNLALFSEIPTNLNQLVNGPGYITGYTETDTLASVTGRGATTTNAITVGGLIVDTNTLVVDATNDRVGIGRTSPLYKIDVAGNARFDNELYVGGVWSSSYGPRTSQGNILFQDWNGNVRARINTVDGVTSVGNRKLSLGILDINSGGVPEIKINTKIPFALGGADFTVNIKGFQYGGTNMVSLSIGWHYYLGQFYSETAISNGSFSPTITLGVEPEGVYAGCVVIHLSNVGYWPKLYVESVYSSAYADDYVANWSWSDAAIDGLTDISVLAYKPLETSITGSAGYATNAGNSTTTSQTNFTTLTLSNAAVATQAWVQTQGYLTSLPAHNHDDRYYTETESDARFYLATNPSGYITSSGNTSGYSGSLSADDNRTISPSEIGVNQLKFGFTSWSNNNSAPWADFLHLRSYGDHTGGSDNLIMFKKSGIGMRIWQQTFGSSTAYSSYADVWTTENFSSTDISNWNAAYNDKINTASFNTANGVLTLTQQDGGTVTVDLDGRYLTSDTDAQTLTWDGISKTLGITNGNDVILSELATEDYVLSQGFVTSVANLAIQTIGGDSGAFNLDTVSGQHGFVRFSTGTWGGTNPYPGNYSHVLSMNQSTANGNRTVQMYMGDVPGALFWRMNQAGTLHPWERIWTAANDGADSGLNADLLDGNHASAFALASHNHDDRYYTESEIDSQISSRLYQAAQSSLDVNAFNGTGLYRGSTSSWTNRPTVVHNGGALLQIDTHPGSYHSQLFFDTGGDRLYFRNANAGSWGSWLTFIHSGNIGSQSVAYATSAGSSTNLYGPAGSYIKMSTSGTSYQYNYQVRENDGGYNNTNEIYAPQLAFHWAGVVASSIMMESSGRIAIRNNPGTGYESFVAGIIYSSGYGNSTQWNTAYGWGNHADAPYWNVSSTDPKDVESTLVTFRHDVTILGTLTESSSIRFKENITPLDPALDKVNQLEAVSYNKIGVDNREIGLIAEDVAELFPEVVTYNEEGQPQGIQYQRLSVILLKALQELSQEVNELKKKLN